MSQLIHQTNVFARNILHTDNMYLKGFYRCKNLNFLGEKWVRGEPVDHKMDIKFVN